MPIARQSHRTPKRLSLLVIEDEPGDVTLIREALSNRPVSIEVCSMLSAALLLLSSRSSPDGSGAARLPDLILLDIHLPVDPGTRLLEERRRNPAWGDIPVIVFTSRGSERESCLRLGAADVIRKPAVWSEWEIVLNRIIDKHLAT